jgi:16S rRNA (cytosine967-C5)-methyltransferase
VLWRGEPLDRVIGRAFRKLDSPADRGLARAIAGAVLRRLPDLDALIDSATKQALPADSRARMVLRMALAQALVLETPPHAVIATALPLLEGGPRRLVHGVLSTLLKRGSTLPEPPSLPEPWAGRWHANWGESVAAAAAAMLTCEPDIDLTLQDSEATATWADRLGGTSLMPGHVRIPSGGRIEDLPGYGEGAWWVQDLAAALPARLLRPKPGERTVDLCAAPGGKTMQIAAAGAEVTAVDVSPHRLERVRDNLARTGLSAEIVAADALKWQPEFPPDKILLDAPCLGTGIFRRHPDVLHIKTARQADALAAQQAVLLDRAADLLRPGGTLVYCVCSLEPEEGEAQLEALAARRADIAVDPIEASEIPAGLTPHESGWLRVLPGDLEAKGGLDGFFMARLVKA